MKWIKVSEQYPPQNDNYDESTDRVQIIYLDKGLHVQTTMAWADYGTGDIIWFLDNGDGYTFVLYWLDGVPEWPKDL